IADSRTSWLVAEWREPPETIHPAPPRPLPCVVLAADGSQIVSDRHDLAPCYLLNVGCIALRYGTGERALLTSRPQLSPPDEDMADEVQGEQVAIAPKRLAIRRLLAELAGLAELITDHAPRAVPMLALCDGSLILWPLETEAETFRAEALAQFQAQLEIARQNRAPLVGYISLPQSRDVVNSLRVFRCPHARVNCDVYCPNRSMPKPAYVMPDCAGTERITDADLFRHVLKPGERSAIYGSSSPILQRYEDAHRICFFYLHTGVEVARVEIPAWVAEEPELLAQTHALCMDQAQKGGGYPVALAEAHEQAIVRGPEREAFFTLMERAFVTSHHTVTTTQKALAKRARRV
ncbi:MAG TPA: DNA double-strand break repair nuclease NurA, partial [Chthonomonadaceae bacterium]|nr:DNA double-strand break repair nuclease NurA [Chthonomonadaceae bacterium]